MPWGSEQLAAVGQPEVNHHVAGRHREAGDLHDRRRDSGALCRGGPNDHAGLDLCDTDLAAGRRYERSGGKADRTVRHAARLARDHGHDAVDSDRAVDQLHGVLGALRPRADLEGVRVPVLGENESPKALEGSIQRELLSLVELAGWQVLLSGDGRVELGVSPNLWVIRVGVGLLAPEAGDGIEIWGAKQRDAHGVHDLEFELVDRERSAYSAAAAPAGRAAGDGEQNDRDGKLEPHALMNQTRPPCPQRNALAEPNGAATRIHLEWPRIVKPRIPRHGSRPGWRPTSSLRLPKRSRPMSAGRSST